MCQAFSETHVHLHVTVFIQQSDTPGRAQGPETKWGPLRAASSQPASGPFLLLIPLKPNGFKCLCRN